MISIVPCNIQQDAIRLCQADSFMVVQKAVIKCITHGCLAFTEREQGGSWTPFRREKKRQLMVIFTPFDSGIPFECRLLRTISTIPFAPSLLPSPNDRLPVDSPDFNPSPKCSKVLCCPPHTLEDLRELIVIKLGAIEKSAQKLHKIEVETSQKGQFLARARP